MSFTAINQVIAYWEGLRAGRSIPMRSEVNPRGIESALENAFILERIAPRMARFRIAGLHLADLMGMEVRGMPFTSFFAPEARKEAGNILEAVFQNPEIAEMTLISEKGIGKPELLGKIVLLPLKSDLGDITRLLGCFVTDGKIGRSPRRFEISSHVVRQISSPTSLPTSVQEIVPEADKTPARVTSDMVPGFEEPKASFKAAPKSEANRSHLRLLIFDN